MEDTERFLSSLYHYKLPSNDQRKETIEIQSQVKVNDDEVHEEGFIDRLDLPVHSTRYQRTSIDVNECKNMRFNR